MKRAVETVMMSEESAFVVYKDGGVIEFKPGMVCVIDNYCPRNAKKYGRTCKILRFKRLEKCEIQMWVQYLDNGKCSGACDPRQLTPVEPVEEIKEFKLVVGNI